MNTLLPASLAPTGTISWLPTLPKCTGSRWRQTGQMVMPVSPSHVGQVAVFLRWPTAKAGGTAPVNPAWSRSTGSTSPGQRVPFGLIRPVHRNQACSPEISS